MLTDIDEDIEALLYAQVYHGKSSAEDNNECGIIVAREDNANADAVDQEGCRDDIGRQVNDDQPANLEPTPDSTQTADPDPPLDNNLQCSEISTSTAKTAFLDPPQIPVSSDNLVADQQQINQNFCPGTIFFSRLQHFKTKITWSDKCEQALQNVQAGVINEKQFFRCLRRVSVKEKKRKKYEQKKLPTICSDIVYLTDSSEESDIEIVNVKKKNMEEVTQISDSGDENDDIIYVEPPPVPIITVGDDESDDNEDSPIVDEAPSVQIDEEEASNDFLPAATTGGENFNFSLHGSEFQDAEFVRPANPTTDHYETESSTSTSDFNRDSSREFSNTVKTIVFNEVDFPKDIFDDSNNLEKFGELITPKRKNKSVNSEDGPEEAGTSGCRKRPSQRKSSESSSESDYDASESHQHLPHLSPMVSVESASGTKKAKKSVSLEENQDMVAGEDTSAADKKTKRKRKKKNTEETTTEDLEKSADTEAQTTPSSSTKIVQSIAVPPVTETKKNEPLKKNPKQKKVGKEAALAVIEDLREQTERIVGNLMTREGRTRWLLRSEKAGVESTENVPLRKKKKKKKKNQTVENLDEANNQASAETDSVVTSTEKCNKRKSDNSFEKNNEEAEKNNKKKKRNSSSKENNIEEIDQDREKADENLIRVDDDGDILLIEKPIPLHVIESSESDDDDVLSLHLGPELELQLANVEEENEKNKLDDFDVENIQKNMSDDPLKWQVNIRDINKVKTPSGGPRCRRCKQAGHIAIRCPNKQELPRCFLCGFEGHQEPRCKNKVCFTCGAKGSFSTVYCYRCVNQRKVKCVLCNLIGHSSDSCPDLWRRYHSTTKRGPLVVPKENRLRPRSQRWCSGCAKNGHLEFQCKSYRWLREYPVSSPVIFGHSDVYNSEVNEPVEETFDLREVLDSNRDSTDLRNKLNDRRMNNSQNSSTNSIATMTETTQTDAVENNTNAQPQTSTEAPQPSEVPLPENPPPPEVPQTVEVSQPSENPILPTSTERIQPENKSKRTRQNRDRRPNPASFVNNYFDDRNVWWNNSYQSLHNPNLGMDNRPYLNQIQQLAQPRQLPHHIQFSNHFNSFPNQIRPYSNHIQQMNFFNPMPANMLYDNYYQPPARYFDFTRDSEPWLMDNPQMPINQRLNYCEPRPLLDNMDFSHRPNNRNFSRGDYSDAPFTITSEASPRLLEQSASFDGLGSQEANVSFHDPSLPVVSLDGPIKDFDNSDKNGEVFKLQEATAEKFLNSSVNELRGFLRSELQKLDNVKVRLPRLYKKKLSAVKQLKKAEVKTNAIKKQLHFHFKLINMFLFGICRLLKGAKYVDYLRNFVRQPGKRLNRSKREGLLKAYDYIFGGEHQCCDYLNLLNGACAKPLPKKTDVI